MTSKFVEIVPPSRHQGNCIPFAASYVTDFGWGRSRICRYWVTDMWGRRLRICGGVGYGFWMPKLRVVESRAGRHLRANRHRARRQEFRQFCYFNRDRIANPARPYCSLSLHFLFNDRAQYQKCYRPNTYPNSQPLGMSFLQDRS